MSKKKKINNQLIFPNRLIENLNPTWEYDMYQRSNLHLALNLCLFFPLLQDKGLLWAELCPPTFTC